MEGDRVAPPAGGPPDGASPTDPVTPVGALGGARNDRVRRLTTQAVTVALGLGLACFVVGLGRGLPAGGVVVRPGALAGSLARLEPAALVSVGVLLLLLAPLARVVGLVVGFWYERDRAALAASLAMLVMLALTFLR